MSRQDVFMRIFFSFFLFFPSSLLVLFGITKSPWSSFAGGWQSGVWAGERRGSGSCLPRRCASRAPPPSALSHPPSSDFQGSCGHLGTFAPSVAHLEIRGPTEGCWLSAELMDRRLQVWSHCLAERGDKALGFWATSLLWGAANSPLAQVLLSLVGLGHRF